MDIRRITTNLHRQGGMGTGSGRSPLQNNNSCSTSVDDLLDESTLTSDRPYTSNTSSGSQAGDFSLENRAGRRSSHDLAIVPEVFANTLVKQLGLNPEQSADLFQISMV